ncbi:MAG: NrfD/PsrC family molybdoenzyme membrane anchor subunit [Spirochaetota bacterium]
MKPVAINSLLEIDPDKITFQKEWSVRGRQGKRSLLLEIALFAGLIGPGFFAVSFFSGYAFGYLVSFFLVLLGYGIPHLLFLGRIGRFWMAALKPQRSWISRGFIFAGLFLLFSFLASLRNFEKLNAGFIRAGSVFSGLVLTGGGISSLLLAIYPGFLFSVLKAIPFWNTAIIIPLFLTQAAGGGIALCFIFNSLSFIRGAALNGLVFRNLLLSDAIILVLTAVFTGAYLIERYNYSEEGKKSIEKLTKGNYQIPFIFIAMGAGLIIPLIVVVFLLLAGRSDLLPLIGLLQLTGIFSFKYCMLNAGAYKKLYKIES